MTSLGTTAAAANPAHGPLIAACLRHTDLSPGVDPVTGVITRRPHGAGASPAEFAALEIALRVAAAWGGRVLAVTAGPPDAGVTLREAVAAGAQALRVAWPAGEDREPGEAADGGYLADLAADEGALAKALAAMLRAERPALVVCGDRSADRGTGALPAFLAHELGAEQALGLVRLEVEGDRLIAERRLPAGRRERLLVGTPAVCSVEAAGVRLRRAALPAMRAAVSAAIPVVNPDVPPSPVLTSRPRPYLPRTRIVPPVPAGTARERLLAIAGVLADHEPPTLIGPVSPAAAATELLAYLHRTGYIGQPPAAAQTPGGSRAPTGDPASAGPDGTGPDSTGPSSKPDPTGHTGTSRAGSTGTDEPGLEGGGA